MNVTYNSVKNCKWANPEQTLIYCEVDFDHLDDVYVPFTADPNDKYSHGKEIYARAVAGDFGAVAPYAPPPLPSLEFRQANIRSYRDQYLRAMDEIVSNPLRWATFSPETQHAYVVYRQALLDVPQQSGFPDDVIWPTPPQ